MKEPKKNPEIPGTESKNAPDVKKERKPRVKYITLAERFKYVPDVVWNGQCQTYLTKLLASITMKRKVNPGNGMKWKRNEYENLVERGLWDAKAMSDEFLLIAQKKSNLPRVLRNYIEMLLIEGMNTALEHYKNLEAAHLQAKASKRLKKQDKSA